MIRRKKQTLFLDATEETTIGQVKKMLEVIVKKAPDDQQLYKIDTKEPLNDTRTIGDCGYKSSGAKAQDPSMIGLRYRLDGELLTCNPLLMRIVSPKPPIRIGSEFNAHRERSHVANCAAQKATLRSS